MSSPSSTPPLMRLQATRARMRDAMTPPPAAPAPPPSPPNSVQRWLRSLRHLPVVGTVAGSLSEWWAEHPFRPVAQVARDASTAAVAPVAQKHPLLLVSMAAAAGALVLKATPWKLAIRSVLFAGLVPKVASKIVAKLPVESWFTMLGTMFASRNKLPPSVGTVQTVPAVTVRRVSAPTPVSAPAAPLGSSLQQPAQAAGRGVASASVPLPAGPGR